MRRALMIGALLALAALLAATPVLAAPGFVDDTPAAYLYGNTSARAIGMGGTYITVGDTPAAGLYSPAALGGQRGLKLEGMHVFYDQYQFNALGLSLGSLGLNYLSLSTTGDGRDEAGLQTGELGDSEQAIVGTLGLGGGPIRLGLNVKYLTQEMNVGSRVVSATGLGADAGATLSLGTEVLNVRLGVSARDLPLPVEVAGAVLGLEDPTTLLPEGQESPKGTLMVWQEDGQPVYAEEIPMSLRVGVSARVLIASASLEIDHINPEDVENSNVVAHLGTQVYLGNVRLRAGAYTDPMPFNELVGAAQTAAESGGQVSLLDRVYLTAGIGIQFFENLGVDYALEDSPVGLRHYLSAQISFGG